MSPPEPQERRSSDGNNHVARASVHEGLAQQYPQSQAESIATIKVEVTEEDDEMQDGFRGPGGPMTSTRPSPTVRVAPSAPAAGEARSTRSINDASSASRPKSTRRTTAQRSPSPSPALSTSSTATAFTTTTGPPVSITKALKGTKKQPLTAAQKRANHILSEQTRRSAIKDAFKNLVDLLVAGADGSGIFMEGEGEGEGEGDEGDDDEEEEEVDEDEKDDDDDDGNSRRSSKKTTTKNKSKSVGGKGKGKATGRGRGRKAEFGNGVRKSLILDNAVNYIKWLERGNVELVKEGIRVRSELVRHTGG